MKTLITKTTKTVKYAKKVLKRVDIPTRIQYNRVMIEKELKKYMTVYLDMDGVIADFFKAFAEANGKKHWKDVEDIETKINELAKTDFFNTLELYPTSKALVDLVKKFAGDDWGICSSPLRGDHKNSSYWKKVWLSEKGFVPPKGENLILTSNKPKYAVKNGKPNVLIDDKPENISNWIAKGGIGIRYQANKDSLTKVKKELTAALN